MIYLFTALYCEAQALIRRFGLVRDPKSTWLQGFYSEEAGIRLTITGVGEVAAAAAVGSVCAMYRPGREDVLFNVGICACREERNGIFLCNKITEQATGKTFYPDMLYRHDFYEASLVTGMIPLDGKSDSPEAGGSVPAGVLYDMEAAAVYQAGSVFFGPHQMIFLKIVSDRGTAKEVTKEQAEHLMEKYQDSVADYIRKIGMIIYDNGGGKDGSWQKEEELIEKLCGDLHCSMAMRASVREWIRYLTLSGTDHISAIENMYEKGLLPCKDKREGKLRFEELKRRVL